MIEIGGGASRDSMFLYWVVKIASLITMMGCWGPAMAYSTLMKKGTRVLMGNNKSDNKKEKKRA